MGRVMGSITSAARAASRGRTPPGGRGGLRGGGAAPPKTRRVIIAYVFPKDGLIDPAAIAADELTHINYAFANVARGQGGRGLREGRRELQGAGGAARRSIPTSRCSCRSAGGRGRRGSRTPRSPRPAGRSSWRAPSTSCGATTSTASTWTGSTRGWWATATCSAPRTRRTSRPSWPSCARPSTGRARR